MTLKTVLDAKPRKKRKNGITLRPDFGGWLGPKPARTKAEKIAQIKNDFIDERALVVEGATAADFAEYPSISAAVSVQSLIQCIDSMKDEKTFLVVLGLDKATPEEQEKFLLLIKDRQVVSSKLPKKVQLLIPVKDTKALLPKIQSLTFKLKVN